MPSYYRRRRRRRYIPRRRRRSNTTPWYAKWMMKSGNIQDVAYSALKGVYYLKSLINVEMKKFDIDSSTSTSGNVILFNEIGQGDTDQTRSGNSILMRSLSLRGYIKSNASATSTRVRLVIFIDKQQISDTAPAQGDILDGDQNSITANLNNNTVGRFSILANKVYTINQFISGVAVTVPFKFFFRLQKHARYNGTTGADIQKNGVYMLVVHDEATNVPTIGYTSRLTYTDN